MKKTFIILSIAGFVLLGLSTIKTNLEITTNTESAFENSVFNLYKYTATPVFADTTNEFDFSKYGGYRITPEDKEPTFKENAKSWLKELPVSTLMSVFLYSALGIIIRVGGVLLLIFIIYKTIMPNVYKPEYTKDTKSTALFVTLGLIVCVAVSLFFGMDNKPPCLEKEYDNYSSYCVEYDDTVAPLNYKDKIDFSGKIFGIIFPTFLYFVYKKKKKVEIRSV